MFNKIIFPTFFSLVLLFPVVVCFFWYFNGFYEYLSTGDGRHNGLQFLIQNVTSNEDPTDAIDEADDFIDNYINPIIIFAYSLQNFVLLFWLIIGRYLKVNKPGIARRYMIYWFIIAAVCSLGMGGGSYYYMEYYDGFFYIKQDVLWYFLSLITIFSFFLFLVQSWIFTSKVMAVAVPFVSLIKRISFRKSS